MASATVPCSMQVRLVVPLTRSGWTAGHQHAPTAQALGAPPLPAPTPHAAPRPTTDSQINKLEITYDKQFIAAAGNPHVKLFEVNSNDPQPVISYEGHAGA